MKQVYQKILDKQVTDFVLEKNLTLQDIMITVFEALLYSERQLFLSDKNEAGNKGNGYYERFLKHLGGAFELRIPRDRLGRFHPFLLEIMKRNQKQLDELALKLYSHGLSQRSIQKLMQDFYSGGYSPGKVYELVKDFEEKRKSWQQRTLNASYHMVMFDAIHMNVRREKVSKEAFYVLIGLTTDYRREIIGLYTLPSESSEGWKMILSDIQTRGVKRVGLFVSDELSGITEALT